MRFFRTWCAALLIVLSMSSAPLWAQAANEKQPAEGPSWPIGYCISALGAALGIMGVCRPGRRFPDIKLELPE